MPLSERRSSSSRLFAASSRASVRPGPPARSCGLVVGQEEDVRLDDVVGAHAEAEDAQRDPRTVGGDGHVDRRAVAGGLAEFPSGCRVEAGGHEDRASGGVEVEDLGGVGREQEAVLLGPAADLVASALEDRDLEGVDLRLEDDLGAAVARGAGGAQREGFAGGRRDLTLEALQRPVPAPLDAGGDAGERGDRADLFTLAREFERRDVVLDAVVVGGEGRRAHQLDGAVLADQATAGAGGTGGGGQGDGHGDQRDEQAGQAHSGSSASRALAVAQTDAPQRASGSRASAVEDVGDRRQHLTDGAEVAEALEQAELGAGPPRRCAGRGSAPR